MRQLASSMTVYRKQCNAQFQRISELTELSFADQEARRAGKVQSWSVLPTAGSGLRAR